MTYFQIFCGKKTFAVAHLKIGSIPIFYIFNQFLYNRKKECKLELSKLFLVSIGLTKI